MKREIKFRAWIPTNWDADDNPLYEMTYDLAFEEYEPINDLLGRVEHLMQYTGLKDRNGKEIYEGDIVESSTTSFLQYWVAEVRFSNGAYQFYLPNGHRVQNIDTTCYRIIGNIYENPELLTP